MENTDKNQSIELEEQHWFENVYQGDKMSELTLKVIIVGAVIGILLISSNIYLGLKTGITQGGSIIAAIIAFALIKAFRGNLTLLENNNAQTMASAATGLGIMVSAIPALMILGFKFSALELFVWVLFANLLGVLYVIPLRKQFVVIEKLAFPSGTACAEIIRAMHAKGSEAIQKAKILLLSGIFAGVVTWFRDGVPAVIPYLTRFPGKIADHSLGSLNFGINWSPMLFGVGIIVGPRIGISLLLGGIICWGVLAPLLANAQIVEGIAYPQVRNWTMWTAVALMVSSGLMSLGLRFGTIVRAFQSMAKSKMGDIAGIEISFRQWIVGVLIFSVVVCLVMQLVFHIPAWATMVAIILAYIFAIVAVRAYGETDINPVGAMGYSTQIIFGGLAPGNMVTSVMTAGVTASGANLSADMMQDFKTGYLLGATPKKQTFVQLLGVTIGSIIAVPIFFAVTGAYGIATEVMPAPSAVSWSGMAELLSKGFSALPPYTIIGVICGIISGMLLSTLERTRLKKFLPSPFGIGIGIFLPAFFSITIFLGSVTRWVLEKRYTEWVAIYGVSLASGAIVGESVVGVLLSVFIIAGII